MRRVRIECTAPRNPDLEQSAKYPAVNGVMASIVDTRVFLVDDVGTKTEIPGCTAVSWSVSGSDAAVARIEVAGAEIAVDGILDTEDLSST